MGELPGWLKEIRAMDGEVAERHGDRLQVEAFALGYYYKHGADVVELVELEPGRWRVGVVLANGGSCRLVVRWDERNGWYIER